MSRALVIRGADFAVNAVAQVNIELPYDAEATYLQSDGDAYIDSGINATSDTQVEAEFNLGIASPTDNIQLFGASTDTYEKNFAAYLDGVSPTKAWNCRYGTEIHNVTFEQLAGDYIMSNLETANKFSVVGGSTNSYTFSSQTFTGGNSIYIFARHTKSGIQTSSIESYLKIKSFKLYQGGQLVRNFIPVRVGQVGYFYDRVSRELFGNAAESGAFVVGPDK